MRRRLYPLPIETLVDHPRALALPSAGFGGLCRIILHYWATDTAPLPIADHELMHIGRMHAPTWRTHKSTILSVFEEIRPSLDAYHRARVNRSTTLLRLSQLGNSKRALQAATDTSPRPAQRSSPLREPPSTPRPAPPKPIAKTHVMVDR